MWRAVLGGRQPFATAWEELRITSYPRRSQDSTARGIQGRSKRWERRKACFQRRDGAGSAQRRFSGHPFPRTVVKIGASGKSECISPITRSAPPDAVSQSVVIAIFKAGRQVGR